MQPVYGVEKKSLPAFKQARNYHHYHYRGIIYKIGTLNTLQDQTRPNTDCIKHLELLLIRNQWGKENLSIRIKKVEALIASLEEMNREYEAFLKFTRNNPLRMATGAELSELDIIQMKKKKYWEEWFRFPKKIEQIIVFPVRRILKAIRKLSKIRRKKSSDTYSIFKSIGVEKCSRAALKNTAPLFSTASAENQPRLERQRETLGIKAT
ncbi:MAG: hypothetical protein K0S27_1384 [Gammaproteobacteria bacterium]|jgi:hypothetical protein|nr:hypothetical protein [Gammaproteobacteria bacterium]